MPLFSSVDKDADGYITVQEASTVLDGNRVSNLESRSL